jgi:putative transposase
MKLTNGKIIEIIRKRNNGWSTNHIRKKFGISERRVNQILHYYNEFGVAPKISPWQGRPQREITENEVKIIKEAYQKYRFSASLLEHIIRRDYELHIPHNRIHKVLLMLKLAKSLNKTVIRKKKIRRYKRRHSLSLVHIDWHQRPRDGPHVFSVEDDASRALLALIETDSPTTEYSIQGMDEASKYGPIKQVLSDNGSQFTCNHPDHREDSIFEKYCKSKGIHHIRTRPKHPQSNGKVEKWFDTYERHRDAFSTKEKFQDWYNHVRPHTALKWTILETPWQAFERKLKK